MNATADNLPADIASHCWHLEMDGEHYTGHARIEPGTGSRPKLVVIIEHGGHIESTGWHVIAAMTFLVRRGLEADTIAKGFTWIAACMWCGRPSTRRVSATEGEWNWGARY